MASVYLNTVYNHYLTSYRPSTPSSRYDTHKKSELRSIYTSIVKLNKESPWYLPNNSKESQAFAIGLKENSRNLHNTITSLGSADETTLLDRKIAFSSNDEIATVSCMGEPANDDLLLFDLEVNQIATPQENLGTFLPNSKVALPPNQYSFDLQVQDTNYELQFKIQEEDTNPDIQAKLVDLLNNANIGLTASIVHEDNLSALKFQSNATGTPHNDEIFFKVSDYNTSQAKGVVEYFGLDYVSAFPEDAKFTINDEVHTSPSNHFQLGNAYEINLHNPSGDSAITVGLKADYESLIQNVSDLLSGYNAFIVSTTDGNGNETGKSKLLQNLDKITNAYKSNLSAIGIDRSESGALSFDTGVFEIACASSSNLEESLSTLKSFASSLLNKSSEISLDPMAYTNRTIAAYKNPGKSFSSPYITSAYSGMIFNSYC